MRKLLLFSILFLSLLTLAEWMGQASTVTPFKGIDAQTLADITAAQEAYFAKTGKYLQIIEGAQLPSYETGDISKLEYTPPSDYAVDVWQKPNGEKGYTVRRIEPITSDFVTSTTSDEI